MSASRIEYSEKYADDHNEYRYEQGELCWQSHQFVSPLTIIFFALLFLQSCHSSKGSCQDASQESLANRIWVAQYWCPTKSRMATLCYSQVSHPSPMFRVSIKLLTVSYMHHLSFFVFTVMFINCDNTTFRPEPHILLFRRPLGTDPQSGRVDPELERKAREEYRSQFN